MPDLLGDDRDRLVALGVDADGVLRAAAAITSCLRAGHKILTFGNGGSAADAQHFAAELTGRFELERPGLPAIALTTDSSALTAIANDYGYGAVFARQVEALGSRGDVALGISTSGNSPNVVAAIQAARRGGLTAITLCGSAGCRLCEVADVPLVVAAESTAIVQEIHLIIEHALCRAVDRAIVTNGQLRPALPPGQVLSLDELMSMRAGWRAAQRSVVWTNGCFDILHAGHLASLAAARELGDILVVGVNDDASVRRLKGAGRPVVPVGDRAAVLAALRTVDYVVVFSEDTPEEVLERIRPEVACKGADYAHGGKPIPEQAVVEAHGGRVAFLPVLDGRSTTQLLRATVDDPV